MKEAPGNRGFCCIGILKTKTLSGVRRAAAKDKTVLLWVENLFRI